MKISAVKTFFTLVFFGLTHLVTGQTFDAAQFSNRENIIDTLLINEKFEEVIPIIENQIVYLTQTGQIDSLGHYTYNLGHAYLKAKGAQESINRTELFVNWIEENQTDKSLVLTAISDLSWIYYEAGKDSLCYEADQRYLSVCNNYPGASPLEKSTAHYSLGFDFQMLFGNAKKAIYHFQEALIPVLPDSLKYKKRVLDCMNALGAGYFRNGAMGKSRAMLGRALNFSILLPDSMDKWLQQANIYGNLALGYQDEGNLVKSKDYLYRAIAMRKNILDSLKTGYERDQQRRLLISNYHNLAALNLAIGDVSKAYSVTQYVSQLRKEWLVADHPDNSKTLEALGSIKYTLGEYDEALTNFNNYLSYNIAKNGMNSYGTAVAYQRIAKVLFEQEDYAGAIENYSQTIAIGKEITDAYSGQELAMAYMMRSQPYAQLGMYQLAESDIRTAQKIYSNTLSAESPILNKLLLFYAQLKIDQNQLDSAAYFTDLSTRHLLSKLNTQAGKYNNQLSRYSTYLPDAYCLQAEIILKQSDDLKHKKEALIFLEKAAEYLRSTQNMYTGETSVLTHFDSNNSIYSDIEDLYYQVFEATGDSTYLNSIFQLDEEHKSVLIRRHLNSFSSLRVANVPDSIIRNEQRLIGELSDIQTEMSSKMDLPDIEAEYEQLRTLIQTKYPEYYALRYNNDVATISDIKNRLLKPGQNLIQYILTDSNAFAIVINRKRSKAVKLENPNLQSQIETLNKAIIAMDQAGFERISKNLYTSLFQPLEPYFDGSEIYIVPDGNLFYLNFETLIKPTPADKPDYLINHYTISYLLSSTTAMQYSRINHSAPEGLLSFAPGFFDAMKDKYKATIKNKELIDEHYIHNIQQPFAVAAARDVTGIFSGKAFLSDEATERNFKKEAANYRIIHLGTHTEINNLSPLLSRLVLSKDGANESDDDDGYLHAYEIYNLSLRAELAVLTACETGIGKFSSSEGSRSLAYSFAYAGCPSIVMSLWQIDEKTSSSIIEDFYKNLASGMPKNKALRSAKLNYINTHKGEIIAPYYWSGLVLVGDINPISSAHGSSIWWFIIMALAALTIVIFFVPFQGKNA